MVVHGTTDSAGDPVASARRKRLWVVAIGVIKKHKEWHERILKAVTMAITSIAQDGDELSTRSAPRVVERSLGKWRGSTVAGYSRGDEITIKENFRCSSDSLGAVVILLYGSSLDTVVYNASAKSANKGRIRSHRARELCDPPTLRFKVCACLYSLGQGGTLKVKADACGIGRSTLYRWLGLFADAVIQIIKPIYMPAKPFEPAEREAVQKNFASRRGIKVVTLACDGTHLPFRPKNKRVALDYRNYKGWYSILAVAFVDSYYRFFDVHVGYPGRAGDNTVLAHYWLMKAINDDADKWLGPGGIILGDSGASDGDKVFLNPYHCPLDPDKLWFNFCHSSTRFFVEQAFGIWKSRFRVLLDPLHVSHKLTTKLIYSTTILHNMFIVHSRDNVEVNVAAPNWELFLSKCPERCPTCIRDKCAHCIHMAYYRSGSHATKNARVAPSELRDHLCSELWNTVCFGPDRHSIEARMKARADKKIYL